MLLLDELLDEHLGLYFGTDFFNAPAPCAALLGPCAAQQHPSYGSSLAMLPPEGGVVSDGTQAPKAPPGGGMPAGGDFTTMLLDQHGGPCSVDHQASHHPVGAAQAGAAPGGHNDGIAAQAVDG